MARKSYFVEPVRDNTQPWSMAIILPECSSLCDARLVWKFWSTIFCSVERRGASTHETHHSGSLSADQYTPLLEICCRWNIAGDQSEQMNNKPSSRIILDFLLSDSHSTWKKWICVTHVGLNHHWFFFPPLWSIIYPVNLYYRKYCVFSLLKLFLN